MKKGKRRSNKAVRLKKGTKPRDSGEQYRLLFESNPHPMWVYDLETLSFLAVNDAAIHHYGYSRDEFLSMTIKDIRPSEDVPALLENVSRVTSGIDAAGVWRHKKKDGSIIFVEITSHTLTFKGRRAELVLANNITERRRAEERLAKMTESFLGFGPDPVANINRLTALCGELMGASSALYNRLDWGMLCSWGQWNTPPGYKDVDKPEGHICYDMISRCKDEILVIRDLPGTRYWHTDPNVKAYGLKTYIGKAVKFGSDYVGSLCAVYQADFIPEDSDLKVMEMIASAIGIEENRLGAKEELSQSEEKYRSLIENIQDGIFIAQDGRIKFANEGLAGIGGYTVEELIGKDFRTLIAPDDLKLVEERYRKRLAGEKIPHEYEIQVLHRDGKTKRIVNLNVGILNYHGRKATMGTVKDITEKRQIEKALLDSEARFRATFEQAAIGMVRFDLAGKHAETNSVFQRMLGYSGEELRDMVFTEFTHPDDAGLDMDLFKELAVGRRDTFRIKKRYLRKNGSMFWGRLTVSLVRDSTGKPLFAIGMVEDITERKQAEEKQQMSEEKYRTLVENIQDGVFIIQDFKIQFANEAFLRMGGYSVEEEVTGKDFRDFIAPEDLEMVAGFYHQRLSGEKAPKEYEFNALHKDGKTRVTVNINVGLVNYNGRVAIIGTLKDVTERKRSEEKLHLFRNLIERSNDAIFVNKIESGQIVDANEKAYTSLGYTKDELFNMKVIDIEDSLPDHFSWREHVKDLQEKGYLIMEGRHRRKNGTSFPVEVNVNITDVGKQSYMVAVARDITERKQAEEMQKERARAELYGFMVSALPVFASGVPSSVRNSLVSSFADRFEKNIKPRFEDDMKIHGMNLGKMDAFMQWISRLFSNFGISNKIIQEGTDRRFEFMDCPWAGEARGNPIFCFICRTIVIRSFTWTSLKGVPVQNSSIASGARTCTFEFKNERD